MTDWMGLGVSVMEVSHRSREFVAVAKHAEATLRRLLAIPDDYAVLFLQGGGFCTVFCSSTQFECLLGK